jgi:hypothetical protein
VNGKDAHRLSICAMAMRYGERPVSDASPNRKVIVACPNCSPLCLKHRDLHA